MSDYKKYKVFIAHSSIDTWVARQLQRCIESVGAATFLDVENLEAGDDYDNIIKHEIPTCNELLVLLTPWTIGRQNIWMELGAAWGHNKRIIFILYGANIDDLSTERYLPEILKKTQTININEMDKYFKQLSNRIIKTL